MYGESIKIPYQIRPHKKKELNRERRWNFNCEEIEISESGNLKILFWFDERPFCRRFLRSCILCVSHFSLLPRWCWPLGHYIATKVSLFVQFMFACAAQFLLSTCLPVRFFSLQPPISFSTLPCKTHNCVGVITLNFIILDYYILNSIINYIILY